MPIKTFRYKLYPSPNQLLLLEQTLETCRRWYNLCLAERKAAWEGEQRTVGKYEQLAKVKDYRDLNPFAAQVHSHILQVTTVDLDRAFQAFFRRAKAGEKPGYPRFRGHGRFASFGLKEYRNGFRLDGRRLKVSGIGRIAVRWHRPLEGQVKTLRLVRKADGWYACFACEVEAPAIELSAIPTEVGLDVGIKSLVTTSDGERIDNPKWYRAEEASLRVLQRRVSRRKRGGSNRRKAVEALRRQHDHIANRRADFLNKLACDLVTRYDRIALEDLQVANLARGHGLSKSILDAGWGYFRSRLTHKAECAGRVVVAVPPAYTSKTCSNCGAAFENLTLADRWVSCECGLSLDRDHNAALNLLRLGRDRWGATWPDTASVPQEAVRLHPLRSVTVNRVYTLTPESNRTFA